jgi:hypothetical protein
MERPCPLPSPALISGQPTYGRSSRFRPLGMTEWVVRPRRSKIDPGCENSEPRFSMARTVTLFVRRRPRTAMKFARGGYSEFDLAAAWNTNEFSHTLDPQLPFDVSVLQRPLQMTHRTNGPKGHDHPQLWRFEGDLTPATGPSLRGNTVYTAGRSALRGLAR